MKKNLLSLAAISSLACYAHAGTSYQDDLAFLKQHTAVIELSSGNARVAIAPAYQARVMTSTASGTDGSGFGWINPPVIAAGIKPESERTDLAKHIHVFGGEERLWLGPEGGPFAFFFPPKVQQIFANWKTPAVMDTEPFEISGTPSAQSVTFSKSFRLQNRAENQFIVEVTRRISLTSREDLVEKLGDGLNEKVSVVSYTTENTVKNAGRNSWTRETGAPSIWLLGMYKPTPQTTIVIPFKPGPPSELGPIAKTGYFGEIPQSRINITDKTLFFKGDGKERGKLGIPPQRSKGIAGSWQPDTGTLTLIILDEQKTEWPYVDSQWKEDVAPFGGDLLNSYNDGPPEPGAKPLGPFYELETSSPALFLKPGESHTHRQTTIHLTGAREALNNVAQKSLGVGLDAIEKALP